MSVESSINPSSSGVRTANSPFDLSRKVASFDRLTVRDGRTAVFWLSTSLRDPTGQTSVVMIAIARIDFNRIFLIDEKTSTKGINRGPAGQAQTPSKVGVVP